MEYFLLKLMSWLFIHQKKCFKVANWLVKLIKMLLKS